MRRNFLYVAITFILLASLSTSSQAQERLCDTAFEDCRAPLWALIDKETVGIDIAYWFMQDTSIANKIIARHQAGVPVRILVDPRANPTYAGNEQILNQFKAAGIPMRFKHGGGILHWKMMLFVGPEHARVYGRKLIGRVSLSRQRPTRTTSMKQSTSPAISRWSTASRQSTTISGLTRSTTRITATSPGRYSANTRRLRSIRSSIFHLASTASRISTTAPHSI